MTASASADATKAVTIALDSNAVSGTVSSIVSFTHLSETTVRLVLKELEAAHKLVIDKQGNTRFYSLKQPSLPKAAKEPKAPKVPATPTGKTKKATKPKGDRPAPKPGARREQATARDKQLHDFMIEHPEGMHGTDLVEALGVPWNLLYIAVWRLHRDGVIEKFRDGTRSPVWRLKRDEA